MTQAIHHVQLNEKLQQCYDILDSIQKTYRNYNGEYIQLVQAHPQTMNNFFDAYEADILSNFKIYRIERKAEIEELLKQETERKQAKLEKAALKKLEQEQKAEEAKRAAEEAKGVKPTGKAPAKAQAKGKGGKDEKPVLDVPQLEVPKVIPYKSEMGNDYIKERPLEEIVTKLMSPPVDDKEESDKEEDPSALAQIASTGKISARDQSTLQAKKPSDSKPAQKGKPVIAEAEAEELVEEQEVKIEQPKFLVNDYMEKANKPVPQDPDGTETLHAGLLVTAEQITEILEQTMQKNLTWLQAEKQNHALKTASEGKEL